MHLDPAQQIDVERGIPDSTPLMVKSGREFCEVKGSIPFPWAKGLLLYLQSRPEGVRVVNARCCPRSVRPTHTHPTARAGPSYSSLCGVDMYGFRQLEEVCPVPHHAASTRTVLSDTEIVCVICQLDRLCCKRVLSRSTSAPWWLPAVGLWSVLLY